MGVRWGILDYGIILGQLVPCSLDRSGSWYNLYMFVVEGYGGDLQREMDIEILPWEIISGLRVFYLREKDMGNSI